MQDQRCGSWDLSTNVGRMLTVRNHQAILRLHNIRGYLAAELYVTMNLWTVRISTVWTDWKKCAFYAFEVNTFNYWLRRKYDKHESIQCILWSEKQSLYCQYIIRLEIVKTALYVILQIGIKIRSNEENDKYKINKNNECNGQIRKWLPILIHGNGGPQKMENRTVSQTPCI